MPDTLEKCPSKTIDTIHRKLGDEVMAVNLQNKFFYNLDPVGTFIWEHCDGHHTVAQIAQELVKEYEVEPEVARRDCAQFIQELVLEGILVWSAPPD
jgi:hypothetical protein